MNALMLISFVAIVLIAILSFVLFLMKKKNTLASYEPLSEDEELLISIIDEEFQAQMIDYARTMKMTPELMDYLKDKKEVLDAVSYFVLLQTAKKEKELKENWQSEQNVGSTKQQITHNEKMILQRIKKLK